MRIQLETGNIIELPDGATPAQIDDAVSHFQQAKPSADEIIGGLAQKPIQGATVGLGDELQAALASGIGGTAQRAGAAMGMDIQPQAYGDIYERNLAQSRQALDTASKAYPKTSAILEIAGGLYPGMAGYNAAKGFGLTAAKTSAGRRGLEALLGGTGAAAYGFGTGEGGGWNRAANAIESGVTGAIMSPAVGYVGEKVIAPAASAIYRAARPQPKQSVIGDLAGQLKAAIDSGDVKAKNSILAQIAAGADDSLPVPVPLTQGNITQKLQAQDLEERALKGGLGYEPQRIMADFTTKQNQALRSNISSLIRDNDLPANAVGDDIVNAITNSYLGAKGAKDAAYQSAKPLMDNAWIFGNSLKGFRKQMEDALLDYPSDVAKRIVSEFDNEMARAGKGAVNIPFSRVEAFRKRMNNLGAFGTPESAAGGRIKGMLDQFIDSGQITGDQTAVAAIQAARKASATLKRDYLTKTASPLVREIVGSVQNNAQVAPEKIFQAISTGNSKQNANNVASLKKILGDSHPVIGELKNSILKDVRERASDASGFLSPAKLAGNIDRLIYQNRTVANELMTPDEIKILKSLQDVSRKIAYKAPGVVNNSNTANLILRRLDELSRTFVGSKIPMFAPMVNSLKESAAAARVGESVNPSAYKAMPIFGGAVERLAK